MVVLVKTAGSYIANRVSDKVSQISDRIFMLRSGSAADTQAVADIVAYNLALMRWGRMRYDVP